MPRSPTHTTRCNPKRCWKSSTTSPSVVWSKRLPAKTWWAIGQPLPHHHPEQNLAMTGFAVPAVAAACQLRRPLALEVRRGQVVENQVRLQTEQIAEAEVKLFFDAPFLRQKVVEGLVPQLQLLEADFHPPPRFPLRPPAAPGRVADVEVLQPGGQGVLTAGTGQTIGDQREDALRQRLAMAQRRAGAVQDRSQGQLVEQMARRQDRSPGPGLGGGELPHPHPPRCWFFGLEHPN